MRLSPAVQGRKKANPAADPRKMRRTIAEDPDWCVCVCVCVCVVRNRQFTLLA